MAISISKRLQWKIIIWSLVVFPVVLTAVMFYNIWNGNLGFMPSFEELENPKSNLASEVYSEDGVLLGTYFKADGTKIRGGEWTAVMNDYASGAGRGAAGWELGKLTTSEPAILFPWIINGGGTCAACLIWRCGVCYDG